MTDDHRTDLVYGHVGEARYVSELQKWEFARVPNQGYRLKQIGSFKTTLSGFDNHQASNVVHSAASRSKGISSLQASDPFLAPAAPLLPPLAQVSEHVDYAATTYDPLAGDLLAFGKAKYDEPRPSVKSVNIAALVTGPRGENVRFVRLLRRYVRNSGSKDASFHIPTLQGGEDSLWLGPGSPIQQVCFSVSAERSSSLLAVRTLIGIVIFRPIIRRNAVPVSSYHGLAQGSRSLSASRLDPNPILTISIEDIAKIPFADVTFNPWYDEQVGVIDEYGQWSIFEIAGPMVGKSPSFDKMFTHSANKGRGAIDDAWGKMFWAADVNTMAIVHRHSLDVYNVKSRRPNAESAVRKAILHDSILDVKRNTRDFSMLYVLTSTKVLWIQIRTMSDDFIEDQPSLSFLLSCWHYRSFNDPSLRLSVAPWRHFSTLGLSSDSRTPQSFLDIYELVMDLCSGSADQEHRLRNVGFRTLHLSLVSTVSDADADAEQVELFRLYALHPSLSVSEGLYQHLSWYEQPIPLVDGARRYQANLKSSTNAPDDFLVPDALCSEDEESSEGREQRNWLRTSSREPKSETSEDPFTFSNEWLVKSMNRSISSMTIVTGNKALESHSQLVKQLRRFVKENDGALAFGVKLLNDALKEQFAVSDLDNASNLLCQLPREGTTYSLDESPEDLESLSLKSYNLIIPSLSSFTLRNESQTDRLTLVSTYNSLVKHWVTPLPPKTPSQTRVSLNRILRIVALQFYLSVQSIESTATALHPEPELPITRKGVDFSALVVRSKTLMTLDSSQSVESQQGAQDVSQPIQSNLPPVLPTPVPSRPASSRRSTSLNATVADEAYTRLSALTHLKFQPALRDTGKQLLAHWEVGKDPTAYDWAAKKEISERAERESPDGDTETLRQRKRREKHAKRQLDNSQRAMAASSQQHPMSLPTVQAPATLLRSDPVLGPRFRGSSPPTQGAMLYTQEEPGRFGGRPEKGKAVRPTRREGF